MASCGWLGSSCCLPSWRPVRLAWSPSSNATLLQHLTRSSRLFLLVPAFLSVGSGVVEGAGLSSRVGTARLHRARHRARRKRLRSTIGVLGKRRHPRPHAADKATQLTRQHDGGLLDSTRAVGQKRDEATSSSSSSSSSSAASHSVSKASSIAATLVIHTSGFGVWRTLQARCEFDRLLPRRQLASPQPAGAAGGLPSGGGGRADGGGRHAHPGPRPPRSSRAAAVTPAPAVTPEPAVAPAQPLRQRPPMRSSSTPQATVRVCRLARWRRRP